MLVQSGSVYFTLVGFSGIPLLLSIISFCEFPCSFSSLRTGETGSGHGMLEFSRDLLNC